MKSFTPATSLATYPDNEVNRSLEIVGEVKFWHPCKIKHLCRDINGQNYHLYCALGKHLLKKGLITDRYEKYTASDYCKMLMEIVEFLPDNFVPYKLMGGSITVKNYDWDAEILDLFK